jgi:signal transduction histidine kinase
MATPSPRWKRYGGFGIATIGFLLTRIFVAETISVNMPLSFLFVSLPPLLIGLGVTVFGVILAVGRFSPTYVRTVTIWCGLGVFGLVLLLIATQFRSILAEGMGTTLGDAELLVGNLLLGGAVGGLLLGDRSAANARKRRKLKRTANRAAFVNRLLRHDVLNAAAIIEGHADLLAETPTRTESVTAIDNAAATIKHTITDVGRIASPNEERTLSSVPLAKTLTTTVDELRSTYPDQPIRVDTVSEELTVVADDRLDIVLTELIDNAVVHGGDPVTISVATTPQSVAISVVDNGTGLPETQRALLTSGAFPEYDDPTAGFGLQAVRLLVERYGGRISVDGGAVEDGMAHRITVRLPRHRVSGSLTETTAISRSAVVRSAVAGVVAGVCMGGFLQLTAGTLPIIGALYGVSHVGIGWITHLFHSVIFALLFATGLGYSDWEPPVSPLARVSAAGLGWGVVLWLVAAGFIMPAWLLLLDQPAVLPNLTLTGFVAHLLWGLTLGWSCVVLADRGWGDNWFHRSSA